MIEIMANVISASNDYDGDRLNNPVVWETFMHEVIAQMEICPDEEMRLTLDTIDRALFQEWIDNPDFWTDLNREMDRRGQLLMTVLPSEHQGNC